MQPEFCQSSCVSPEACPFTTAHKVADKQTVHVFMANKLVNWKIDEQYGQINDQIFNKYGNSIHCHSLTTNTKIC